MNPMTRIYFNEVATRDGFQIEPGFIPTDSKVALVDADRKSTRLNSSHIQKSRMPSSA